MLTSNRIISYTNLSSGNISWFFLTREGTFGPFDSKQYTVAVLEQFMKSCLESGNAGGRSVIDHNCQQVDQAKKQSQISLFELIR